MDSAKNQLKWGVLGAAQIADRLMPFLQSLQHSTIHAVASRSMDRAQSFSQKWSIPVATQHYQELIENPEIQVLYIPLANHLHYVWTKKALLAGKHVLCEKPITLSSLELQELIELSQSHQLILAEGFMYRHHSQTEYIKKIIESGELGKMIHIRAAFHSVLPLQEATRLFPETGGGVQWDIACYLANLIQFLTDQAPIQARAWGRTVHAPVLEILNASFEFQNGITANFESSFLGPRRELLEIHFESGWLQVPRPFKPSTKEEITVVKNRTPEMRVIEDPLSPYLKQFLDFEKSVLEKKQPLVSLKSSLETTQAIELALRSLKP